MKKTSVAEMICFVLALAALAFGPGAGSAPAQTRTMTIGMSSPFSGFAATWGIYAFRSLELLVDEYNERGGLNFKKEKVRIRLISYDDKYDATEGQIVARRLISNDKVDVFTVFSGGAATAAREISRAAGRFQLGTSWARNEPSPDYPLVFARNIRYPENVPAGTAWLSRKYPLIKKLAKVGPNSPFGKMSSEMVKYAGPKAGMEVVADGLFETGVVDFTPLLLKIIALRPGVIDVTACPPDSSALIVKQARELGYQGMVVHWSGANFEVCFGIVGAATMEGVISGIEYGEPYTGRQQAFKERYLKNYAPRGSPGSCSTCPPKRFCCRPSKKPRAGSPRRWPTPCGRASSIPTRASVVWWQGVLRNRQPAALPDVHRRGQGGESIHLDSVPTGGNYPRK